MKSSVRVIIAPEVEPLSVTEAENHLRINTPGEDPTVAAFIMAARDYCEGATGRALITQTLELALDTWPCRDIIELPRAPIQCVQSIKYTDYAGVEYTVDPATYMIDLHSLPPRIALNLYCTWPTVILASIAAVRIRYVAGYGDTGDTVPEKIRQAMKMLIGHWYENREEVIVGKTPFEVPQAAKMLLAMEAITPL